MLILHVVGSLFGFCVISWFSLLSRLNHFIYCISFSNKKLGTMEADWAGDEEDIVLLFRAAGVVQEPVSLIV